MRKFIKNLNLIGKRRGIGRKSSLYVRACIVKWIGNSDKIFFLQPGNRIKQLKKCQKGKKVVR